MRRLAAFSILLFLAGCGGRGHDSTSPPAAPGATLVTFHRGGGFAVRDETLRVRNDGRAVIELAGHPYSVRLAGAEIDRIRAALDLQTLAEVERTAPSPTAADAFTWTISAGGHTATTDEATPHPRLARLIGVLDAVYLAHAPRVYCRKPAPGCTDIIG